MISNQYSDKLAELGFKPHNENEPLYKYTGIKTFKAILENNTLRYSNPLIFNDPFEFTDDSFDFDMEDDDLRRLLRHNASFAPDHIQRQFEENNVLNDFPKDLFINIHKKRIESYKLNALVFCSSLSPLIPLMWAHYSEKHTGVCFGIKIPFDFRNEKEMVITKSVKYNSAVNPRSIFTENNEEIMLAVYNWIYSKSDVWDYEQEMRTCRIRTVEIAYNQDFIVPVGAKYEYLPFQKETLIEIHFGLHTTYKDIDEVQETIETNGYNRQTKLFKIEKIKGTYKLERKEIF